MMNETDPSSRIFFNAGCDAKSAHRPSEYDALKAAGSPYADDYQRGYTFIDDVIAYLLEAIPSRDAA